MRRFTSLLLAVGAAAHSWSLGRPTAPSPTILLPADRDGPEAPASISVVNPVQRLPPAAALGRPVVHGSDFVPDHVLVVTYETLVNGSTPGPTLRLQPGKTSWIRVYNNMPNDNLTMVSIAHISLYFV
jgi:FtsP/CotA-like multicopper oxidase with cupredoxin domain